ncbi:bifunctional folylpolyglutamate synthase/dihydrofolate synthase [Winogradskyella sp. DF17]|uniref:Dihydrofolate synthase/folylpolyglutamate synthase n=1 Tax=Winogradskyella pelagia TaxID=2819984 RepID=A0ABS3T617_9FLAO|nr:folylpolyglutamate synthase/dihydrofolate synthase family protein [Winogradskyella sp. DF17]MBO3117311.1 bifunctional folylpolyglutamate synthase/dihydrofolate synthase [Winogradskyella sp. DF17]
MTYKDTLSWMFKQLPMYQRQGKSAYKEDLSNALKLDDYLGCPQKRFKSIHVAGTNGKGSTSHMLASILQEAGYKVGLYTSPHLKDFRERIRINGNPISKKDVIAFITRNKQFFEEQDLSFFEMTVGMAFEYFATKEVDIAVIEVGLGGRLDSTNIITPVLSVITNIGFDHVNILGDTLGKIASEKAGIIKYNIPVVVGESHSETMSVFRKKATECQASIVFADDIEYGDYKSDLIGSYQKKNINTVLASIKTLKKIGYTISENNIKEGLLNVVRNTGFLGRWQILSESPKIICDTAHNREGLELVMTQLSAEKYRQLHIVFGTVNDKNIESVLDILPKTASYYFCKPNVERGLDVEILANQFSDHGFIGESYVTVRKALKAAKNRAHTSDIIFIGGSTFVVAEVI